MIGRMLASVSAPRLESSEAASEVTLLDASASTGDPTEVFTAPFFPLSLVIAVFEGRLCLKVEKKDLNIGRRCAPEPLPCPLPLSCVATADMFLFISRLLINPKQRRRSLVLIHGISWNEFCHHASPSSHPASMLP